MHNLNWGQITQAATTNPQEGAAAVSAVVATVVKTPSSSFWGRLVQVVTLHPFIAAGAVLVTVAVAAVWRHFSNNTNDSSPPKSAPTPLARTSLTDMTHQSEGVAHASASPPVDNTTPLAGSATVPIDVPVAVPSTLLSGMETVDDTAGLASGARSVDAQPAAPLAVEVVVVDSVASLPPSSPTPPRRTLGSKDDENPSHPASPAPVAPLSQRRDLRQVTATLTDLTASLRRRCELADHTYNSLPGPLSPFSFETDSDASSSDGKENKAKGVLSAKDSSVQRIIRPESDITELLP